MGGRGGSGGDDDDRSEVGVCCCISFENVNAGDSKYGANLVLVFRRRLSLLLLLLLQLMLLLVRSYVSLSSSLLPVLRLQWREVFL